VWRFFSSKPAGPGLGIQTRRSEICLRKSQWRKWNEIKEVIKQTQKILAVWAMRQRSPNRQVF